MSKKILLLNQAFYPDGVSTAQHTLDLATYMTEKGFEVSVFCSRYAYESGRLVGSKFEIYRGIRIHRLWCTGFGKKSLLHRILDSFSFDLALLWKLLWSPRFDLVISFTSPPLIGFFGALFCFVKGGKSAQWLMDVNPDAAMEVGLIAKKGIVARVLTSFFEWSLKKSQHIVVLDRWMKGRILQHHVDANKITITPPWVVQKVEESPWGRKDNPFRIKHGLVDKFVILFSGNHSIVHPIETLIQAAVKLKDDKEFHFLFIGDGVRAKEVTAAIEKYQLKNVLQLPRQPREVLQETLAAGDVQVLVMGTPMSGLAHVSKIYGILGTGKPFIFIGPKESHVVDIIRMCGNGYQVEQGDVTGVVSAIRAAKILSQESLRQIEKVNERFVLDHFTLHPALEDFNREILTPLDEKSVTESKIALYR